MLETGWSENRLAAASDRTVLAIRHALYARANADTMAIDIDDRLRDIHEASLTGRQAASAQAARNRRARSALLSLRPLQRKLRELLLLDDKTPVPEDEE